MIPTRTQLSIQRRALIRYQRGLYLPLSIAAMSGDSTQADELLAECERVTVCVEVLDRWILEIDAAPIVAEAERILEAG